MIQANASLVWITVTWARWFLWNVWKERVFVPSHGVRPGSGGQGCAERAGSGLVPLSFRLQADWAGVAQQLGGGSGTRPSNTPKLALRMCSFPVLRKGFFSAARKQGVGLRWVIIWERPGISSDALEDWGWGMDREILLPFVDGGRGCLVTFSWECKEEYRFERFMIVC